MKRLFVFVLCVLPLLVHAQQDIVETNPDAFKEMVNENNDSYLIELGYNMISTKPEMFADSTIDSKVSLQGVALGAGRSFALSDSLFTVSMIRAVVAEDTSDVAVDLERKSTFISAQFVQQLGFNITSFRIDRATLHPFIGIGLYGSSFKDEYVQTGINGYNKLTDVGGVFEAGLMFRDQISGFYSTIKLGTLKAFSTSEKSEDVANAGMALQSSPSLGSPMILSVNLGFQL